jgi:hypothetical protein
MSEPSFTVNGKNYNLPTDLTMGEMCDAEQHFGVEFGKPDQSNVRMAAAMMFIAIRREDPSVTPEDIRELPLDVLEKLGTDAVPPVESSSGWSERSGGVSSRDGDDPDADPEPIGSPASVIGVDSDLATSPT